MDLVEIMPTVEQIMLKKSFITLACYKAFLAYFMTILAYFLKILAQVMPTVV
jgi:hypothetical protein